MSRNHDQQLRITEIFYSLQGESDTVGLPTVFIRLTGCPLRCNYCDTEYAFSGGEWMDLDTILTRVSEFSTDHVTVTGGEPLAQHNCLRLLEQLCNKAYKVSLETSGALDISRVDSRVSIVMDLKTPGSGEQEKNLLENIRHLQQKDQLKFVIGSREDYDWSVSMLHEYRLTEQTRVLFSPIHEQLEPATLADWILEDKLQVRFQVQLHKYLWNDAKGR